MGISAWEKKRGGRGKVSKKEREENRRTGPAHSILPSFHCNSEEGEGKGKKKRDMKKRRESHHFVHVGFVFAARFELGATACRREKKEKNEGANKLFSRA